MTQTIALSSIDESRGLDESNRSLLSSHAQIASILRSRLGRDHAQLLATPVPLPDGSIRWDTPIVGNVLALSALDPAQAAALRSRADALVAEIQAFGHTLAAQGSSSLVVASLIEQALQAVPMDALYSVDGRPVLVRWGAAPRSHLAPPSEPERPLSNTHSTVRSVAARAGDAGPPTAAPLDGASTTATTETTAATVMVPARESRRWWPWLALFVLAAVLLTMALLRATAPDETTLAIAERQNQVFEQELQLRKGVDSRYACVPEPTLPVPPPAASAPDPVASAPEAPPSAASQPEPQASAPAPMASAPPPKASEPPPQASAPLPKASEPLPKPKDLFADLARRVANAKDCPAMMAVADDPLLKNDDDKTEALRRQLTDRIAKNCKQERIQQALKQCPGERPPELAPEMALVFDASGSMQISLDATPQEIKRAENLERAGNAAGNGILGVLTRGMLTPEIQRIYREPQRIGPAREAAGRLVQAMPSDVSVGLVMVDDCNTGARNVGFFAPAQRGDLLARIRSIEPKGSTPLGDGIAKAGALLDGVDRQSVMVVISDGESSCGPDPCAVAAELARSKPNLKINVIDITGAGAGNCLARATGGRVYTANSADDIAKMVRSAGQDAIGPQSCQKP